MGRRCRLGREEGSVEGCFELRKTERSSQTRRLTCRRKKKRGKRTRTSIEISGRWRAVASVKSLSFDAEIVLRVGTTKVSFDLDAPSPSR